MMSEKKKNDYPEAYRGILKFSDFSETLATLFTLRNLHQTALSGGSKKELLDIKKVAAAGERRARGIAGNPKVQAMLKEEKREIALWFNVWRENPPVFFTWLALRIGSEVFRNVFGAETAARIRTILSGPDSAIHDR